MKIALPFWNGRISPVFDVAKTVRVVAIENGTVTRKADHRFKNGSRVARLEELNVDVLICAAISRPLEAACWVAGIEVVSDVCGTLDQVIESVLKGSIDGATQLLGGHTRKSNKSGEVLGPPGLKKSGRPTRRAKTVARPR